MKEDPFIDYILDHETKSSVETTRSKPLLGDSNRRSTGTPARHFSLAVPIPARHRTSVVKSKNEARATRVCIGYAIIDCA